MKIDGIKQQVQQVSQGQTSTTGKPQDVHSKSAEGKDSLEVQDVRDVKSAATLPKDPLKVGQSEDVLNDELLERAVKQANKSLDIYDKMIERTVHEKTKTVMYVLRDTKTHEIIREFPPRKIQDMIAKMWELAGLFVDEKA